MQFFKRFKKGESSAMAIEYGLIATLIAVATIVAFASLSNSESSDSTTTNVTERASAG